ncbi:MAG: hypothetical protein ACE5E7_06055 [Anaerolineae bacterium]
MKIGEFEVMVTSSVDEDELAAEIWKKKTAISTYELGSVHIKDGKPIIYLGPDTESEDGVWTLDYHTFKQIVKALDDFLVSIGYPVDTEGE